jgi:acrylyl-CoA reductase (NADPH)
MAIGTAGYTAMLCVMSLEEGVDSVHAPMARRVEAWRRLARDLDITKLEALSFDVPFTQVRDTAPQILAGQLRGRAIVDLSC